MILVFGFRFLFLILFQGPWTQEPDSRNFHHYIVMYLCFFNWLRTMYLHDKRHNSVGKKKSVVYGMYNLYLLHFINCWLFQKLKDAGLAKNATGKEGAVVTADYCYLNPGWLLLCCLPLPFFFRRSRLTAAPFRTFIPSRREPAATSGGWKWGEIGFE